MIVGDWVRVGGRAVATVSDPIEESVRHASFRRLWG